MKPFYKSKKFWTAIVTAAAMAVAHFYDENLAALVAAVGSVLIVAFGLADYGKEAQAIRESRYDN